MGKTAKLSDKPEDLLKKSDDTVLNLYAQWTVAANTDPANKVKVDFLWNTKDIPIDVRIIATVNEPAEKLIEEGKLRKNLYYRLNVVGLIIPDLSSRKDDIPVLVERFLEKHDKVFGKELWMVSDRAMKKLMEYNYPENVRELENIIMQSVSMAENEHVLTEKLLQMPKKVGGMGKDIEKWDGREPLDMYIKIGRAHV